MKKINKVFSLILIAIFLCQNVAFCLSEGNYALRVPIGVSEDRTEEATDSFREDKSILKIKLVDPKAYETYIGIFARIIKEEEEIAIEIWRENGDEDESPNLSIKMFEIMSAMLKSNKKILALFIAMDSNDDVIGARIVYDLGSGTAEGIVAVRQRNQRSYRTSDKPKKVGTKLTIEAFNWLRQNGYKRYTALISLQNTKSLEHIKKVCELMGLEIETDGKIVSIRGELGQYYTITLNKGNISGIVSRQSLTDI